MNAIDIVKVLDVLDPMRQERTVAARWQRNFDAYRDWSAEHGRPPTAADITAAGLPGWIRQQTPETVTRPQLRQLEQLAGFTYGLNGAPALLGELLLAGVKANAHQPALDAQRRPTGPLAARIAAESWAGAYLTWLTFCTRYGTQPRVGDPGFAFIRAARASEPSGTLAEALSVVPDWEAPETASLRFRRAAHSYERWTKQHGRTPTASAPTRAERSLAALRYRTAAAARAGSLNDDERALATSAGLLPQ